MLYFIEAELMAKQLFPNPSFQWSHDLLDDKTRCVLLGNDVWYAGGTIRGETNNSPVHSNWEVCFLPDPPVLLYVRVGNVAEGDPTAALQRANSTVSSGKGVGNGK